MEAKRYDVTKNFREKQIDQHEAGVELDRLTRNYMAEEGKTDYAQSLEYIKTQHPDLTAQYYSIEQPKDYMAQINPAGSEVHRLTQLKMLKHGLSYPEAQRLVFSHPDNSALVNQYVREARNRR